MTMPTPPPPPPPGWYPDPSGGSRYWDGSAWGPLTAPGGNFPPASPTDPSVPPLKTPEVKSKSNRKVLAAGAAVLLMAGAGVAAINSNDSESSSSSGSTTPWPTVTPEEIQAQRAAQRALLEPSTYEEITPRDFALIAKDPDAHRMRKLVLYGVVTQFDSATGTEGFRANVDAVPHSRSYDFDQNTILAASDPAILADVVEKDFVTMWVSGAESYSYDTQMGGRTTVPKFTVNIIKVTGSAS
jgi:hypothetical protein